MILSLDPPVDRPPQRSFRLLVMQTEPPGRPDGSMERNCCKPAPRRPLLRSGRVIEPPRQEPAVLRGMEHLGDREHRQVGQRLDDDDQQIGPAE